MSSAVTSLTAPTPVFKNGVARIAGYSGLSARCEPVSTFGGPVKFGVIWSDDSLRRSKEMVMAELRQKTGRLAEGIRIFNLPDRTSLGNLRIAESSAPDKYTAEAADRTPEDFHYIQVGALALAQKNTSDKYISTGDPSLDAGEYTFDLYVNEEPTTIEVSVVDSGNGADNNYDLLSKVGRQIEAADDRLQAYVIKFDAPEENSIPVEHSALVVQSRETGKDVNFYFSDVDGDMVSGLGLNNMAPSAGQAQLFYDYEEFKSNANSMDLDEGLISFSLYGTTGEGETLNIEKGLEALYSQTADLVDQYNDYIKYLHENSSDIKSTILDDITAEVDSRKRVLDDIGLSIQKDGTMNLTQRYPQMLYSRPDLVHDALGGEEGFFPGIEKTLETIMESDVNRYATPLDSSGHTFRGYGTVCIIGRTGANISAKV